MESETIETVAKPENDVEDTEKDDEWQDVLGSGQLLRRIVKKGGENKPQRGDICRINITGRLQDGTIVEEKKDFQMNACEADVIQGIDLIIPMMSDGEVSEVKIPPRFGYGETGMPPSIPPSADLVYTIELLSHEIERDLESMTTEERKIIGNKKRERGNWWYSMQEPIMAIQCYRKAIEYLDETTGGITDPTPDGNLATGSKEFDSIIDDRMKTYNNMAAAQIKQGAYDAALSSVEIVLTCQPNNVKALFRKGKILSHKNNITEALKCVRGAYNLAPDDRAIKNELIRLEEREKKDSQKEKDLARKMLGTHKGSSKSTGKDKSKKTNKTMLWSSVAFSIAVGVISVAVYKYKYI